MQYCTLKQISRFWLLFIPCYGVYKTMTASATQCCFLELEIQRFLVFFSNLLPLRVPEVVLFQPHNLETLFLTFCPADLGLGLRRKVQSFLFECLPSRKNYDFQASMNHSRPQFGLLDDLLKVAYGTILPLQNIRSRVSRPLPSQVSLDLLQVSSVRYFTQSAWSERSERNGSGTEWLK